jgi:hypothetical protein
MRDSTTNSITNESSCDNAFVPIPRAEVVISGSTSNVGATTVDIQAPTCGSASEPTAPGLWYTITGNGGKVTVSTCNEETDFDSQISVFTGSCGQLTCIDGNDNACGSQSLVEFEFIQNEPYHVFLHGYGDSTGKFDLQIVFTCLVTLSAVFVDHKVSSQAFQDPSSPQYKALVWMAYSDSITLQSTLSDDELVERFLLVVLFFATGGESWRHQANFLTPSLKTCSWGRIVDGCSWRLECGRLGCIDDCTTRLGVSCNGELRLS